MKAGKIWLIAGLLICIFFWQSPVSAQISPANPANETNDEIDLVHLGDLIDVDVLGSFEYDWRGTLTQEGFLNGMDALPERVFALCRSEAEIATEIAKGYSKYLREPQVVVRIIDRSNRPNSMLYGAVKTPQRFQIKRPVYLNELIILAGGLTDKASGEIRIFRPASLSCGEIVARKNREETDAKERERFIAARQDNGSQYFDIRINDLLGGKKDANLQIMAGDVVTILEAKPIYVIGGVVNPRQIATRSQITVSRAVATAGGIAKDGDAKQVTIYRRVGNETKIIETDLDKIKANEAEDVILQQYDIVDVLQKGAAKRNYPPVVKTDEATESDPAKLPLRVID